MSACSLPTLQSIFLEDFQSGFRAQNSTETAGVTSFSIRSRPDVCSCPGRPQCCWGHRRPSRSLTPTGNMTWCKRLCQLRRAATNVLKTTLKNVSAPLWILHHLKVKRKHLLLLPIAATHRFWWFHWKAIMNIKRLTAHNYNYTYNNNRVENFRKGVSKETHSEMGVVYKRRRHLLQEAIVHVWHHLSKGLF